MHDLRVKAVTSAGPKRFDQYRTPQGSLFLELYCPRTSAMGATAANMPNVPGVPSSLYKANGSGDIVLNVSKLTPTYPAFGITDQFPVWRVYLSNPILKSGATPAEKTPNERLLAPSPSTFDAATRNDLTYQLPTSNVSYDASGNLITPVATLKTQSGLSLDLAMETAEVLADPDPDQSRIIVFANGASFTPSRTNTPGVKDTTSQVFVNRTGDMELHGNQYLVVGPRDVTYIGSRSTPKAGPTPNNSPNNHRIELNGNWVDIYKADKTQLAKRASMKDSVTMVAAAQAPTGWSAPTTVDYIGVNVSEPLPSLTDYYLLPTAQLNSNDTSSDTMNTNADGFGVAGVPRDAYNDYGTTPVPPARQPFDRGTRGPLMNWDLNDDGAVDTVAAANGVVRPGTEIDWSTAYLQRLADPDKPWNAVLNPYITVDWMPIENLTVFSGEENDTDLTTGFTPNFASRQKVGQTMNAQTLAFTATAAGGYWTDFPFGFD